jgi:uncharacterized protein involved in exopolysaccharide biosynthesis
MLFTDEEAILDDATYDFDEAQPGAKPKRPGLPVEPRRLLRILVESRKPLLRALVAASALALIASFFLPRAYESSAQLLYEGIPILAGVGETATASNSPTPDAFVQAAIAPSRVREVRDRLGWDISLDELGDLVSVQLESETSMRIVGRAASADEAHALAQTVLDVFLERQASFNAQGLERLAAENQVALQHAKERHEAASKAYEAFRKKSGKGDLIREQEELSVRAAGLRSKADEAAVEVAAQRARIEELEKAQAELPRQIVATAKRGSPIDSPLAQARADLAQARATLSEEHPTVQALKQKVTSLQAQKASSPTADLGEQTLAANPARSAVDEQLATARAALAAAQERESALRVLEKAVRAETNALAPEEGEARQVIRELELTSKRVEELNERAAKLRDAVLGPLTGFRVLSAPMVPEESERSKSQLLLLLMLPLLTVLIVALVILARRLRDLTVVAPREVAWWGNGPVLGTSIWPRDPDALDSFVDELEDQGMYGAGRTLVVPATEVERDVACSFAMRLAEAPWLAAAILDVGALAHSAKQPFVPPVGSWRPPAPIVTPAPPPEVTRPSSRGPLRKKTMIGLQAVQSSKSRPISTEPPGPSAAPRDVRVTVRMIVPVGDRGASSEVAPPQGSKEEEAFLLTRPIPAASVQTPPHTESAAQSSVELPHAAASSAVMRAAIRLLGDDEDAEDDGARRSRRSLLPAATAAGQLTGVALAWNGPLSGPALRRAARLAHRVVVVVSSGMSVVELTRIKTRLGREEGVGYVLVNVGDAYVDLPDRVGPVEAFWQGLPDVPGNEPRLP